MKIQMKIKTIRQKEIRKSRFSSILIEKDFEPENPKQLEELDESLCKWPIGHPDEKTFILWKIFFKRFFLIVNSIYCTHTSPR